MVHLLVGQRPSYDERYRPPGAPTGRPLHSPCPAGAVPHARPGLRPPAGQAFVLGISCLKSDRRGGRGLRSVSRAAGAPSRSMAGRPGSVTVLADELPSPWGCDRTAKPGHATSSLAVATTSYEKSVPRGSRSREFFPDVAWPQHSPCVAGRAT